MRAVRTDRTAATSVAVTFTAFSLVSALQLYVSRSSAHESATLFQVLVFGAAPWMAWALFAPGILWLGRRFDFYRGRRVKSSAVHLVALLLCHVLSASLITWLSVSLLSPGRMPGARMFREAILLSSRVQLSVLIYAAILGLGYALRTWLALREREVQASRLEAQAAQARLETLAIRLQPHFLFNTLHTVGALIDENPALARTMLVHLGDLLREVLADSGAAEVPLREEMALLRRYLDIEQIRFADRITVVIEAAPESLDAMVPRLLLQPLVENALRHGLAPKGAGGELRLQAASRRGRLVLRVWNDGLPLADPLVNGIGLSTTRDRLQTRHGTDATLVLRGAADGGVETVIELPAVMAPR